MRDFAFVLSLARGFAMPAQGASEVPESADAVARPSSCCGERAPPPPEALRRVPAARSRLPAATTGN